MLLTSGGCQSSRSDLRLSGWDLRDAARLGVASILLGALCLLMPPARAEPPVTTRAGQADWSAVVLMYHRFGEDRYPSTSVPLPRFEEQLDWLQAEGYTVWPLSQVLHARREQRAVPERLVAITVDDAYASVYHQAWPRLRARGWPLTVFVATSAVDRGFSDMMNWDQMREMRDQGVEFANHSVSHAHLQQRQDGESADQWRHRIGIEIDQAQQRLQAELGADTNTAPRLFAYPYGEYSLALIELLRERDYLALGQHSGPVGLYSHDQALPRFPINTYYGDAADFALKLRSLPLPVLAQTPLDPVLGEANPPPLELRLGESSARLSQLGCYATGQGRIEVSRLAEDRYRILALEPLSRGRSRYNCTAPHAKENRWYWYSQLWINGVID